MNTIAASNPTTFLQRVKRFFRPNIPKEKRWKPHVFLNIVSAIFLAWIFVFSYLQDNWKLGIDPQVVKCLPYDFFVISRSKPDEVTRGKMYEYASKGQAPVMKDGLRLVKIAAAVAGDKVVVSQQGVFINGQKWGDLNPEVMRKTKWAVADVTRSYVVAPGKVLMLGTLPRSYDGRYFGPVDIQQLNGRAYFAW